MVWFRLATAIIVFVTSCCGLGYLAEFWVRRRKWREWIVDLMILAIAFLWPAIVVLYTIYDARQYLLKHPHDDAPGMVVVSVISVGAPFLFVASLPPAFLGAAIARRRNSVRKTG